MSVQVKRLVVELEPQIHKEIKLQAVREGRSYREFITDCFLCYMKQIDTVIQSNEHLSDE